MWIKYKPSESKINALINIGISPIVAEVLVNRGIDTAQKAKEFLFPQYVDLPDQFMPSVEVIAKAIRQKDLIFIHGDSDIDGITAVIILTKTITKLGGKVQYFIPQRERYGYGLKYYGVDLALKHGSSILLSVDCGINSYKEVEKAINSGLTVVILDHHKPVTLAKTPYIVSGQLLPSDHYHAYLSGAGLAYMFSIALAQRFGLEMEIVKTLIDIACLGTVADVVPLLGCNRWIVQMGIEKFRNNNTTAGIKALAQISNLDSDNITPINMQYMIIPKINAISRMLDANIAFDLLTTEDELHAMSLASKSDLLNKQRQSIQEKYFNEANEIAKNRDTIPIIIKGQFPAGLIGLIAVKLSEKYKTPAIVFSETPDGKLIGSGRSIEGINLHAILKECSHILEKFGGHKLSTGLSLKSYNFEQFVKTFDIQFKRFAEKIDFEHLEAITIDALITVKNINYNFISELDILEPYGAGNNVPIFGLHRCLIENIEKFGQKGNHLKLVIKQNDSMIQSIGWDLYSDSFLDFSNKELFDIAVTPELNVWNGNSFIRANIKHIELSEKNTIIIKSDFAKEKIKKDKFAQMTLF